MPLINQSNRSNQKSNQTSNSNPEVDSVEINSINLDQAIESIAWNPNGLIPAIAQSIQDNQVLMLAWLNDQALRLSIETGLATYFSRSRNQIWVKGETSGYYQKIQKIKLDCDLDSVLFMVEQVGGIACHTNRENCFFYQWNHNNQNFEINLPIIKN